MAIHSPRNCLPGAGWEPLDERRAIVATSLLGLLAFGDDCRDAHEPADLEGSLDSTLIAHEWP